jgi:hypothetical protein
MHADTIKALVHKMDCNLDGVRQIKYQYFFYSSYVFSHGTVMNVTYLAVKTCKFERYINLSASYWLVAKLQSDVVDINSRCRAAHPYTGHIRKEKPIPPPIRLKYLHPIR